MLSAVQDRVQQELQKLVGLELSATARAADMRGFHFGELRPYRDRTVGEFALHVQCPWRVEGPDGVVSGRSDLGERDGNLQDKRIAEWLGHHDPRAGACLDVENPPVVLAARDLVRRRGDRPLRRLPPHPVPRRQRRRGLAPVPAERGRRGRAALRRGRRTDRGP